MDAPNTRGADPLSQSLSGDELPPERVSLQLLARAQEGDEEALAQLLERYGDRLRRIVRIQLRHSPLRRAQDSMDVVQDTFIAALPKLRDLRLKSAASLLHWLSIIATNQIRDAYGRETADKRDFRLAVPISRENPAHDPAAASVEVPARAVEMNELKERLDDAVAELPEDQRRVVVLRDYCGESWERIAAELARETGAARQLHQRAWIRLRRELRPWIEAGA